MNIINHWNSLSRFVVDCSITGGYQMKTGFLSKRDDVVQTNNNTEKSCDVSPTESQTRQSQWSLLPIYNAVANPVQALRYL